MCRYIAYVTALYFLPKCTLHGSSERAPRPAFILSEFYAATGRVLRREAHVVLASLRLGGTGIKVSQNLSRRRLGQFCLCAKKEKKKKIELWDDLCLIRRSLGKYEVPRAALGCLSSPSPRPGSFSLRLVFFNLILRGTERDGEFARQGAARVSVLIQRMEEFPARQRGNKKRKTGAKRHLSHDYSFIAVNGLIRLYGMGACLFTNTRKNILS